MSEKPHISATQLEMLWRCPEQYRRRYVEREIIPPGISLLQGKGFHRGAETNFRQKIESHADLPAAQIVEAAVAGFEAEQAAGYQLSEDEAARGERIVLGEAKDQLAGLARCHASEQAPEYQPVAVEHVTRIVFPEASHDLVAISDLRDDACRVTDFKTAARKMPQNAVDTSTQLTIYAAAYQIDTGTPPREVRLDVVTKTKKPARQLLKAVRTRADYQALITRINASLAVINAGLFAPCPPGSWQCSPKWCGYWNTCRFVNSERRDAADQEG